MNSPRNLIGRWRETVLALASILLLHPRVRAATNIVLAGENLQARIASAAAGDIMVLQSGTYGGSAGITINKPLAFVRSGNADLQLTGPVAITASGTVSFSQIRFTDGVTSSGGGSVDISDAEIIGQMGANGGRITARKTRFASTINLTNTAFVGMRITNSTAIAATARTNSGITLVIVQSDIFHVAATGCVMQLAYSKVASASLKDGDGTFVGNAFRLQSWPAYLTENARISGSRARFRNNTFFAQLNITTSQEVRGINCEASEVTVENNLIEVDSRLGSCYGVSISGEASNVAITSSIIWVRGVGGRGGIMRAGSGVGPSVSVSYCCISCEVYPSAALINVSGYETLLNVDPRLNSDRSLLFDSPCRDAGAPEAPCKDRDGSRNDIGHTGGPLYDPTLATTDLPMVFWLDAKPRRFLKGGDSKLRIEASGTAGF